MIHSLQKHIKCTYKEFVITLGNISVNVQGKGQEKIVTA